MQHQDKTIELHFYRNGYTIFNIGIFYSILLFLNFDFFYKLRFEKIYFNIDTMLNVGIIIVGIIVLSMTFPIFRQLGIFSKNFDVRLSPSGFYAKINKMFFLLNAGGFLIFMLSAGYRIAIAMFSHNS